MAKDGKTIFGTILNVLRGLLMAVSFSAVGWIVTAALHSMGLEFDNPSMRIISAAIWAVVVSVITFLSRQSFKESFRISFDTGKTITSGQKVISIILAFLFGVSLNRIITIIVDLFPVSTKLLSAEAQSTAQATASENVWIIIISVWIVAPIVEEFIFRGKAYWYFEKSIGRIPAVIITSLIFAVLHGNLLQGIYAFIAALFCCMFTRIMGNVFTGMFAHVGFNASNVILAVTLTAPAKNIQTAVDIIMVVVCVLSFAGIILTSRLNVTEKETAEQSIYIDGENK